VHQGELFGLIGPNGAGKTTTIKILTTLLMPTSGTTKLLGVDVTRDAPWLRRRIGLMFGGERGLYCRLSAVDNLRYFALRICTASIPRKSAGLSPTSWTSFD
jgi:ABC-2 type transport system ATP-binding protein